jgi:hypothetical protein
VITSLIYSSLQAAKKQNIVYLGILSVTNALPVLGVIPHKNNASPVKEKQFLPVLMTVPAVCLFFAQIRFLIH